MLETIREYAAERLAAAGESDHLQRRHLEHYAALAEACYDETLQLNDDFDRLEEERENLRLAFDVALRTSPELALELGRRLVPLWLVRGEFREGRERLAAALACAASAPTPARAWALRSAARLALAQEDDLEVAGSLASEALALFREVGDERGIGSVLNMLVHTAWARGEYGEARRLYEEASEAHSASGDEHAQLLATETLANVVSAEGDHAGAVMLLRDVVASVRRGGSNTRLAGALSNLGNEEELAGETEQARRSLEESIALCRQAANKPILANSLSNLAHLMHATAPVEALAHYSESLLLSQETEEPSTIAGCLTGGAAIFVARGDPAHATSLLGAASAARAHTSLALGPEEQVEVAAIEAQCRAALTPDVFARAWDEGAALDANAAADWALSLWETVQKL